MSTLQYSAGFQSNVQGELKARFRLDARGNPMFEPDTDDASLRHYRIELMLESPRAADIDGVEYYLDRETYPDPVMASVERDRNFAVTLWSYGDYELEVRVQLGPKVYKHRAWLSNLLEAGHAGETNQAILDAIQSIKDH